MSFFLKKEGFYTFFLNLQAILNHFFKKNLAFVHKINISSFYLIFLFMQKSKLFQLLKTLSFKELDRFESYLESPFFNVPKNCLTLFKLIKNEHPAYDSPVINHHIIFKKIFPNKQSNDSSLRVVMTLLTQFLEKFLIYIEQEKQSFTQQTALLRTLLKRGLPKHFKQKYTQCELLVTQDVETITAYYQQYDLITILQQSEALYPPKHLTTDVNQILHLFHAYSTLNQLQLYCHILNAAQLRQVDYDANKLEQLLTIAAQSDFEQEPIIHLYYLALCLLKTKEATFFKQLKPILFKNEAKMPRKELQGLCTLSLNFCNRKVNSGESAYYVEMLDIYKLMLKTDLLLYGKYIHPSYIRNIATVGIRAENWDWVEQFIYDYRDSVAPQFRETVFRYNLAVFHFYKKQFRQALEHLIHTKDINMFYQLDYKNLMLKLYFELHEWAAFTSLSVAFRQLVRSKKQLSVIKKKEYRNFIQFITKLYKLKLIPTYRQTTLVRLENEIKSCKFVNDRQWLLDQLARL